MTSSPVGRMCLGWQYATPHPEPGPPPRRPTPPEQERLNPEWAAAQRREENLLNRPLKAAFAIAVGLGLVAIALGAAGSLDALVAGLGAICCALIAAVSGYAVWQGQRALRSRLADEQARVGKIRAAQESRLFAWQAEHATRVREWQALRFAYEHQKRWYAVCVPDGAHRVDVAGGTLSGWSAMLTTAGANRLAAGGEITVLDLSEGSVALDLIGFARASGVDPLVWVLPEDLPRLDLGTGLAKDALADLLSQVASVTEEQGSARDLSLDSALLERVIDVLAGNTQRQATVASVAAGLRALGLTTAEATGDSESLALALQRSREFLVEQHELQQLPASAMIITYAGPASRRVALADANPGIGGLNSATQLTLEEFRGRAASGPGKAQDLTGSAAPPRPVSWRSGQDRTPPNLGPPPSRPDWRKRRSFEDIALPRESRRVLARSRITSHDEHS